MLTCAHVEVYVLSVDEFVDNGFVLSSSHYYYFLFQVVFLLDSFLVYSYILSWVRCLTVHVANKV